MALLPRAMPGLVAGLAIFWVFLFLDPLKPLRQTMVSIWVAYTLVWLAYGIRLVSSSLLQIDPEMEEAGRVTRCDCRQGEPRHHTAAGTLRA